MKKPATVDGFDALVACCLNQPGARALYACGTQARAGELWERYRRHEDVLDHVLAERIEWRFKNGATLVFVPAVTLDTYLRGRSFDFANIEHPQLAGR